MAITVDPTATPAAAATVVSSVDGRLSAKVDATNAGVMLRADLSALSPVPVCVRFYRGDGTLVRSGDPAWSPGGIAHAYDHEAPVGVGVSYYAQPVTPDLAPAGDPTGKVAVLVPNPTDLRNLWLKSPSRPDLSMQVWVEDPPDVTRAANATFTRVSGARLGLSSWDARSGYSTTLTVVTDNAQESTALEALLDAGTLLLQTRSDYDFPQFYCLPGDWTRSRVARMTDATSRWSVPLTETRRPATLDAPLRVPGLSWATVAAQYLTWSNLAAQVASWDDLVWGWLERGSEIIDYTILDAGDADDYGSDIIDMGGAA